MLPDRQRPSIRFTPDQAERLKRVLKHRGQTAQAFLLQAAMREIEETEAEIRLGRDDRQRRRDAKEARRADDAPVGLGIRPRSAPEAEAPAPPPTPQGQVVVNVGGGNGAPAPAAGGDTIARLATYVTTGPEYERDTRLRSATEMLHASSGNKEEGLALAAQLDAAVAARIKEQPSEIVRATRAVGVAYDKIKDFLA